MKSLVHMTWLHVLLVAAASIGFESLFIHHSLNVVDEGWPLYAAMGLHEGGSLYREVFWVFPPGHVLSAWIAYAIDPPGVVLARMFYAAFVVALCVTLYLLGRRIMPPPWALFGALLLSVAATSAHRYQLVFGYRYLVFAVLVLIAFSRRVESGDVRWSFVAGLCAGVSLVFRLTPAFAASLAVAIGVVALDRSWRSWLRDWTAYGGGLLLVALPVILYFGSSVGIETFWREVVVRPVVMTDLQSLPMPTLEWLPKFWERKQVMRWGVSWQFRLYLVLYAFYAIALVLAWARAIREQRRFENPLLLAFVIFGGVYFVRTLGRSDAAHLYSAIPPICLLLAHLTLYLLSRLRVPEGAVRTVFAVAAFGLWMVIMGGDVFLDAEQRGQVPLRSLGGRVGVNSVGYASMVDGLVDDIRKHSKPSDRVLDLSASPLVQVLSRRLGPGYSDLVMPGTFLDPREEDDFIARLEESPPALVVWPQRPFDEIPERSVLRTAPRLAQWVQKNYRRAPSERRRKREFNRFTLMLPKAAAH